MVTREKIVAEIERVPDERLEELYEVIREFEAEKKQGDSKLSAMARLRQIRISATSDFSTKAVLYDVERKNAE
jgi:propanediol dehydratase small subunit